MTKSAKMAKDNWRGAIYNAGGSDMPWKSSKINTFKNGKVRGDWL